MTCTYAHTNPGWGGGGVRVSSSYMTRHLLTVVAGTDGEGEGRGYISRWVKWALMGY